MVDFVTVNLSLAICWKEAQFDICIPKITHKQKKPLSVHRPRAIYISKSNECPFTVMDLYMQHVGMYPSFWNVQNCRIVFASNTRAIKTFCIKSWFLFPITLIQFSVYLHIFTKCLFLYFNHIKSDIRYFNFILLSSANKYVDEFFIWWFCYLII